MDVISPAIILIILGALCWLATYLLTRIVPKAPSPVVALQKTLGKNTDAVLVIQEGGRVSFINDTARHLFNLEENESINLERLARIIRPSERFLALCAVEGQERLVLDGRLIEATSYSLGEATQFQIVALRQLELSAESISLQSDLSTKTLRTYMELSQAIASSLDLEATLQAVLESIEKLLPTDYTEIILWEAEGEYLEPYRSIGLPGSGRKFQPPKEHLHLGEGYCGKIAKDRTPLLITNVEMFTEVKPGMDTREFPIQSYFGVPLLLDGELIGTLGLGSLVVNAFQQADIDLIQLFSGLAAIAIRNARLYRDEKHRTAELSGLAQFNQAFSSLREPTNLFSQLVQSIVPLIQFEILGFLIYNPGQHSLEGRQPFYGLPSQFIDIYRAPIQTGSAAEKLLLEQEIIICKNATEEEYFKTLGLAHLAKAANLRDTILVPLSSSGRFLGYLQASNHTNNTEMVSKDELRLLTIIASQAAPIIENATLVERSRQRAQRAETLQHIANLASSSATLDEILKHSLQELAALLHADFVLALLLNQEQGLLSVHNLSCYPSTATLPERETTLSIDDPQYSFTQTANKESKLIENIADETAIIPYYMQILKSWNAQSAMSSPLVIRDEGIGELWVGSLQSNQFTQNDLQLLEISATLLAEVINHAYLLAQTDESLHHRVEQLTALTHISRELSTSLDFNRLINLVYEEAVRITHATCGTILLFDLNQPADQKPKIRFAVGDTPPKELTDLELQILESGETFNVKDVGKLELVLPHPGIQSMLMAPIIYQKRPAGLITLHAKVPRHFDESALQIMQSLAAQTAIALGNALQYETQLRRGELLRRELEILENLFLISQFLRKNRPLEETLKTIAGAIREATSFQMIIISVYDEATGNMRRVCAEGVPPNAWELIRKIQQPWRRVKRLLVDEYRLGVAFYIPADKHPLTLEELPFEAVIPSSEPEEGDTWSPQDVFLVPLYDGDGNPLGLISVDVPVDGRRPDRPTLEALELFSVLTSILIEYYQHFSAMETRLSESKAAQGALENSASNTQKSLELLVDRGTKLALQIESMQRQEKYVHKTLEIAEKINHQNDIQPALQMISDDILNGYDVQYVLVAEKKTDEEPRLIVLSGDIPANASVEALLGQRNPLRQVLRERQVIITPDLPVNPEWRNSPLLNLFNAQSFFAFPVLISEDQVIGILAISRESFQNSNEGYDQIITQLSNQLSTNLRNLLLLTETRQHLHKSKILLEFSPHLGNLDVSNILASLVETVLKAIPNAQASWVGILTPDNDKLLPMQAAGYSDQQSMLSIHYESPEEMTELDIPELPLPLRVLHSGKAQRVREVQFAHDYHLKTEDLLQYKKGTGGKVPVSSLCVPLSSEGNNLGILVIDNFILPNAFTDEDEDLASSLCQLAGVSVENARLYEEKLLHAMELDLRSQRLALLNRFSSELGNRLERNQILGLVTEQIHEALDITYAAVVMINEAGILILEAETPEKIGNLPLPLSQTPLYETMRHSMEKLQMDSIFTSVQQVFFTENSFEPRQVESQLIVPVTGGNWMMGWMWLQASSGYKFSESEIDLARTIGNQAAIAIQNTRLFTETRLLKEKFEQRVKERTSELYRHQQNDEFLLQIINNLSVGLDASRAINDTLLLLNKAVGADQSILLLTDSIATTYQAGEPLSLIQPATQGIWITPEQDICRYVAHNKVIVRVDDTSADTRWYHIDPIYNYSTEYHSLLAVPLLMDNEAQGALILLNRKPSAFQDEQLNLIQASAHQFSIALNNATLYKLARSQSESLSIMLRNQQTIMEAVIDGVVVTDTVNNVILFNISAERILEMQAGDIVGNSIDQLGGIFGEGVDEWINTIREWSKNPEKQQMNDLTYAKRATLTNGTIISIRLAPVLWGMDYLGTVSTLRDITHEVRLDRLKSEFVANVSHELRTPITSIKGYAQILLMGAAGQLNEQQLHFMQIVKNNTDRLTVLVNDLLDISRIEAGQVLMNLEPFDLGDLAKDVVADLRRRAADENKPMTFELECQPQLPKVRADKDRMRQVLYNLVVNGYNYTPTGGKVVVRLHSAGPEVQVDVQDNGIGILPKDQGRIFERFYRGEDPLVLATAGTGLGLAISKTLVEMYHGRIWFHSSCEPEKGSTFSFTLPAYQEE